MFQFVHVYNLWTVSETACSYCSHLPFSLCSSWVIAVIIIFMQMCWFIPNCTQNQVITYTNSIEVVFNEQLHFFRLKAISSKNVKFNTTSRTACSYENCTFSQNSSNRVNVHGSQLLILSNFSQICQSKISSAEMTIWTNFNQINWVVLSKSWGSLLGLHFLQNICKLCFSVFSFVRATTS